MKPEPKPGTKAFIHVVAEQHATSLCPCLKKRLRGKRYRIGLLRFDGSVWCWFSHFGNDNGIYGSGQVDDPSSAPLFTRTATIDEMFKLGGFGWIPRAFDKDEDLSQLIAFTNVANNAKTYKQRCRIISKESEILFGKYLTPMQIWNGLPKNLFLLKLNEWYADAVQVRMGR